MKVAITYIALIGLTCAQSPPYKETPPGKLLLDQAIAGIANWGGPGSLQGNPNKSPKPPIKDMIGGLPELFKPKPGSSDWREDTLKGPRKKPGVVWPKNPSPKNPSPNCLKRDLCGPGSGKLPTGNPTGGKIPSVGGTLTNTYGGIAGGIAVAIGAQQLLNAIPGAPEKIQEVIDSITRFQREHFGSGNTVYLLNPGKYGHCNAVKRPDIHPNPEYRKELIRINCPPGTEVEETPQTPPEPETQPEPPRQCFDSTGPIPCGGGQTEVQLDTGRAVCGSCGSFWDPEGGKCRDIKGALIWPSLTPITERSPTPSGQCSDSTGSFPCGGGQTEAELDMGWAVCRVCSGSWDPKGGKCVQKDDKLLWPRKS
ncbi:Heat-labile enterotoxin IIB, A chain [Metarhizium guizhouense ARSEF 977]|uniref:Heat-labile enterotoxin IIB, A chain n=1 Tax=Metarhizium guizhouense (strain ARSEF 977) TaxID=1276136 RepID=A0A0B4H805_METGA|nr:Heat-labile enterotoxin IIB, A chain [Metarhizium guizhouense ARSEF 977]